MNILKKRRILIYIETIACIFIGEKSYRINSNLHMKNSTMPRRKILMNTFISTRWRTRAKNNANLGTKKITMPMMITKKMNMRRKSGMISIDRKFSPYPVLPLDIPTLIWEVRDVIAKNAYPICFPPNVMELLVLYDRGE